MATKMIGKVEFVALSKGEGTIVYQFEENSVSLAVWKDRNEGVFKFEIAVLSGLQTGIAFSSECNLRYGFKTLSGCAKRGLTEFENVKLDFCP